MAHDKRQSVFNKIDQRVVAISKGISYLVGAAILIIMVLAFFDTLSSKLFGSSIPSATEWITYLNILAVFPAVAFVQLTRGHTRVDLLDNALPVAVKKAVRIIGHLLGAAVCALMSWRAVVLCMQQFATKTMSSSSALTKGAFPLWPFALILGVCSLFWMLSNVWSIVRELIPGFTDRELVQDAEGGDGK